MENSKLIMLLRTFTKDEFEEFEDFVNSPFHNRHQPVVNFYNVIKEHYPEFRDDKLSKENIFIKLYKNKIYSDDIMRKLISQLLKLAEDYLAFKNIKADNFLVKSRLLPELNMRRQEMLFKKNYSLIETQLEKMPVKGKEYYYNRYLLEQISMGHTDILRNGKNTEKADLQNHADYLTMYSLIAITELYSYMTNELKVFPHRRYEFRFLEEIKNHLTRNEEFYNNFFFVNLYFNSLMMLTTDDEKYYYNLKNLIGGHYKELSDSQRYDIYALLTNYCGNKVIEGKTKFLRERFELLKESFSNGGQIQTDGSIGYIGFFTIINYALTFKEFSWAENFINENIDKVGAKYRLSTYHYCFALLEYYRGNYGKSLESLAKVKTENYSFKLQIKTHTLMIYYSLNETEQFISLVDSFRHFIAGNKQVTNIHNLLCTNFINFTFRLFKGREDINNFDLKLFKKELLETNQVARKHWLIEKTEELEKQLTYS